MMYYLRIQDLVKQVLSALRAIAGNDDVKDAIVNAGGTELIVMAVNRHLSNAQVIPWNCKRKTLLCLVLKCGRWEGEKKIGQTLIVNQKALFIVIWIEADQIIHWFFNGAVGGDYTTSVWPYVTSLSSQVCEQGCAALCVLGLRKPNNCKVIMESGGALAALQAMKTHPAEVNVQVNATP